MFKAAGYRIGPSEIENCLVSIRPWPTRRGAQARRRARRGGQGIRGAGVWRTTASEALVAELQAHVRGKLAPYEYPKEIEFIDALPMTTTGKVQRRVLRQLEATRAAGPAVA